MTARDIICPCCGEARHLLIYIPFGPLMGKRLCQDCTSSKERMDECARTMEALASLK